MLATECIPTHGNAGMPRAESFERGSFGGEDQQRRAPRAQNRHEPPANERR